MSIRGHIALGALLGLVLGGSAVFVLSSATPTQARETVDDRAGGEQQEWLVAPESEETASRPHRPARPAASRASLS